MLTRLRSLCSFKCCSLIPLTHHYLSTYSLSMLMILSRLATSLKLRCNRNRALASTTMRTEPTQTRDTSQLMNHRFGKISSSSPSLFTSVLYLLYQLVNVSSWVSFRKFSNFLHHSKTCCPAVALSPYTSFNRL